MAGRLEGKVAVITGGCSGMGRGTVELFVEEGARVVVADVQHDKGRELEQLYPGQIRFAACEIRNEADIAAAVALAETSFGDLDIMFNNAAAAGATGFVDQLSVEQWDDTHALILRSVALGIKHAVPAMRRRGGGSIINTSSTSALLALGHRGPAYGTMKAGILHLTRISASDLGPDFIRVNAIIPGWITTSIIGDAMGASRAVADRMSEGMGEAFAKLQPVPRAGRPRDIAEAALFFGSDASSWITGVSLSVDGGLMVQNRSEPDLGTFLVALRAEAEAELGAAG